MPDDRFGERVAVAVQDKRSAPTPSLDDLRAHCRSLLAGYKIPRQLVVTDEIPLTAAGKPDAKAAKALF
jgi:acyl-CoA synthetase (AMP-forming)/AMP-acid ligase II